MALVFTLPLPKAVVMKKNHIIIPALLLATSIVVQAKVTEKLTTANPTTVGGFPHFPPDAATGKGAISASSRLVGKTYLKYESGNFIPVDSTVYMYSNGRGGATTVDNPQEDEHILFDESITYGFNKINGQYVNNLRRIQNFNKDNAVNKLVYQTWKAIWEDSSRFLYAYTTDGKMLTSAFDIWVGSLWTNGYVNTLSYQGNNVVNMSQTGKGSSATLYEVQLSYDSYGNITEIIEKKNNQGIGLVNNERKVYHYNNGMLSEYILYDYDLVNAKWLENKKWEYSYSGKNLMVSTEYRWNGNIWNEFEQHLYDYDIAGNKTTDIIQYWSSTNGKFENVKKDVVKYNTDNQPTLITKYTWDNNNWVHKNGDDEIRLYYQYYFPTNINSIVATRELKVYPVPATTEVNLSMSLDKPQPLNISVMDMSGKVVVTTTENPSQPVLRSTIPVRQLSSGNYIVHIAGEGINVTKKINVVK